MDRTVKVFDPTTARWAAYAREYGSGSEYRHIVDYNGLTSACGTSASHAEVWRTNRNKPKCNACLRTVIETAEKAQ